MQFSKEEREKIDKILTEIEEEQKQNGNKLYSFEEVVRKFLSETERENNYSLRDISY